MYKDINVFENSNFIMEKLKKGILLTSKHEDISNSMTISWGHMGKVWNEDVFIVYVRTKRHTHSFIDKSLKFSVNIPLEDRKEIIKICGTKSGKNIDKNKELGLNLVNPRSGCGSGIKELPFTLECEVIYRAEIDITKLPESIQKSCYPQDVPDTFSGANLDHHEVFYGKIIDAYIIE